MFTLLHGEVIASTDHDVVLFQLPLFSVDDVSINIHNLLSCIRTGS